MMKYKPSRRQFIEALSLTTVASTIPVSSLFADTKVLQQKHAFVTAPYLQALSPDSVSVISLTSQKSFTWVEYGENHFEHKAFVESDGFIDAYQTLFRVKLKGLKPGTPYQYRVLSKEIRSFEPYKLVYGEEIQSEVSTFTTPQQRSDAVSCLILNDIHDRPDSFADLMALNDYPDYEFVVLNGDMFDFQTDEKQIVDHLLKPVSALFSAEKPFIMSRGNHETRGKFARDFKNYFAYPDDKYYYAFRQGPVYWIFLDTGEDKPDDEPVYAGIVDFDAYREEQAAWLDQIMQSEDYQDAPFKVVCMHIPPFHSGDWHGTMHCRELFHPLFEKYNIDLVVSGHTHKYGVHPKQEAHTYPIVIGGGPKAGNRTLIALQATPKMLQLDMKADSGAKVGELKLYPRS